MPSYKRFADNSVQHDSSYKVFNNEEYTNSPNKSPQELQKEFESFQVNQNNNDDEKPLPHKQHQLPTIHNLPPPQDNLSQIQSNMKSQRMMYEQEQYKQPEITTKQYTLDDIRQQLPDTHEVYIKENL